MSSLQHHVHSLPFVLLNSSVSDASVGVQDSEIMCKETDLRRLFVRSFGNEIDLHVYDTFSSNLARDVEICQMFWVNDQPVYSIDRAVGLGWHLSCSSQFSYKVEGKEIDWLQKLTGLPSPLATCIFSFAPDSFLEPVKQVLTTGKLNLEVPIYGRGFRQHISDELRAFIEANFTCNEINQNTGTWDPTSLMQFTYELSILHKHNGYEEYAFCAGSSPHPDVSVIEFPWRRVWHLTMTLAFQGKRGIYVVTKLNPQKVQNALFAFRDPRLNATGTSPANNAICFGFGKRLVTVGHIIKRNLVSATPWEWQEISRFE